MYFNVVVHKCSYRQTVVGNKTYLTTEISFSPVAFLISAGCTHVFSDTEQSNHHVDAHPANYCDTE